MLATVFEMNKTQGVLKCKKKINMCSFAKMRVHYFLKMTISLALEAVEWKVFPCLNFFCQNKETDNDAQVQFFLENKYNWEQNKPLVCSPMM